MFFIILLAFPAQWAAGATGSCVDCHKKAETLNSLPAWYQDTFVHWYGSVHGKEGVTCDKCHGGQPLEVEKEKAHQGILSSRDSKSPVNFKNVPETCGSCHKEVYRHYSTSKHYKNLKEGNLAPNCTTCHGFRMDIQSVKPLKIAGRCGLCHNEQTGIQPKVGELARSVLAQVEASEEAIRKAQIAVELAKDEGTNPKKAEAMLKESQDLFSKTATLWHQFRLTLFAGELKKITALSRKATQEALETIKQKQE